MKIVSCPPTVQVVVNRPDTKYQLGFSVQNGMVILFFHLQYPYTNDNVLVENVSPPVFLYGIIQMRGLPFCKENKISFSCFWNCGRISSVSRALDCRAGGRRSDFRDRTNTQGHPEKWKCCLCPANGKTFPWFGWLRKMAVRPVSSRRRKNRYPISTFVLNTLTLKKVHFF